MDSALIDLASEQFLGQWKRLVSTTNWEKGHIIHQWREALTAAGTASSEYSDDVWSRRVGNVTPQHVGRLRRVYERFGAVRDDYAGLYWSHFQAALDWDDAEMWLEGAVQSDWSISDMRDQRWQVTGGSAEQPADDVTGVVPWDEDAESGEASGEVTSGTTVDARAPERARAEEDEDESGFDRTEFDDAEEADAAASSRTSAAVRPFASLPPLPADVNDAFEAYKLCILRHKVARWQEISRDDMLASLDALKQLALAPAEA